MKLEATIETEIDLRGSLELARGGQLASPAQVGLVVRTLEALFTDAQAEIRKSKRYTLLQELANVDSAKKLTWFQATLLIEWAIVGDGDYSPRPEAVKQAARIVAEHDVARGQMALL